MTSLPIDRNRNPIQCLYPANPQQVSIGATSAASEAFKGTNVSVITLYSDVPCFFALGDDEVVATTDDIFLPAGVMFTISINPPGAGNENMATNIAVIRSVSDGTLYVMEML